VNIVSVIQPHLSRKSTSYICISRWLVMGRC